MITQSNYVSFNTPQFRKLSEDQLERLHNASLEILDRTGVCLYDDEALDLMKKAGVKAVDGNRVHIPPGLIEWAWSVAPKRVVPGGVVIEDVAADDLWRGKDIEPKQVFAVVSLR